MAKCGESRCIYVWIAAVLGANPLQMAWQRQIQCGDDGQTYCICCALRVLRWWVLWVMGVLLQCVLMRHR